MVPLAQEAMKLRPLALSAAVGALVVLGLAAPGRAAEYHVSPLGSDAASGTVEQPWKSVQHAVNSATDGDTVWVDDGVYAESVRLPQRANATDYLTLRGVNKGGATIGVGQTYAITGARADGTSSWIRLQGLKFTAAGAGLGFTAPIRNLLVEDCEFDGNAGVMCFAVVINEGENVTIRRCYAHDCRRGLTFGVDDTTRGVRKLLVEDVLSLDNYNRTKPNDNGDGFGCTNGVVAPVFRRCVARGALDTGFDLKSGGVLLDRCLSYNNHHANYKIWNQVAGVIDSGPWSSAPARLINCLGYGAGSTGDEPGSQCISMPGNNVQLINCTLVGGYGKVIAAGWNKPGNDATTCTLTNCIVVGEHSQSLFGSGQVKVHPTGDHNLYYLPGDKSMFWAPHKGTGVPQTQVRAHPGTFGAHSIFADPRFVDLAGRDFHLGAGSPARRAGVPLDFLTEDFSGQPRPPGVPPDLGALAATP
jgi:hypothetical protein